MERSIKVLPYEVIAMTHLPTIGVEMYSVNLPKVVVQYLESLRNWVIHISVLFLTDLCRWSYDGLGNIPVS